MGRLTVIQWIQKWYADLELCPACAGKFIEGACHPNDGAPECSACRDRGFFHDGRVITYKRCDDLRHEYHRAVKRENEHYAALAR